jgi:hypothetical protein
MADGLQKPLKSFGQTFEEGRRSFKGPSNTLSRMNWSNFSLSETSLKTDNTYPKSWFFEAPEDGKSWIEVHQPENNNDLNGSSPIGT